MRRYLSHCYEKVSGPTSVCHPLPLMGVVGHAMKFLYCFISATTKTVILSGIRNIGFVHSPLMGVADGSESNSMIHITDWMPTFMHIARGQSVDGASLGIDGVDQFSAITTGAEARTVSLL